MKRRGFISKLFKTAAVVGVAAATKGVVTAAPREEEFPIEDLFTPYSTNADLFLLNNDTWLEKDLMKAFEGRITEPNTFTYYNPVYNIYIPIKETYTKADFMPIINWAKYNSKFDTVCFQPGHHGKSMHLCRMFRDKRNGYYKFDFYSSHRLY